MPIAIARCVTCSYVQMKHNNQSGNFLEGVLRKSFTHTFGYIRMLAIELTHPVANAG